MSDLSNKDYNVAIINMFIQLKETMAKEVKEDTITRSHHRELSWRSMTLDGGGCEFEADPRCRDYLKK